MIPKRIDDNTQTFNGRAYTRFGKYFRGPRAFIHRDVWEHHNGPIPPKHHIHHIDHDGANNRIENLTLVEAFQHLSDHQRGHTRRPVAALLAAAKWRKTSDGIAFQRMMGQQNAHYMHAHRELTCQQCKKPFVNIPRADFCSNACRSKWRRASGVDDVERICVTCGAVFSVNKYHASRSCSPKCRGPLIVAGRGQFAA